MRPRTELERRLALVYDSSLSAQEMARMLKCSDKAVRDICNRYGLRWTAKKPLGRPRGYTSKPALGKSESDIVQLRKWPKDMKFTDAEVR